MKKIKKVIIVLAMMIAMVGFVNPMTVDASRTYKVTFRQELMVHLLLMVKIRLLSM